MEKEIGGMNAIESMLILIGSLLLYVSYILVRALLSSVAVCVLYPCAGLFFLLREKER
jgi:hypothetical protein